MSEPESCHGAAKTSACAAFVRESRMEFADAIKIYRESGGRPTIVFTKSSNRSSRSSRAEFESQEMRMQSGCAVPWAAASKPLNDQQQNQLKSNGPADINSHIDGRTRPAGQKALMVFIQTGHDQGAKDCQNRSAPPKRPMFDRHSVKRLPPTVEESETHQSVTDEVAGLTDDMMYLLPLYRARRTKE